LAQTSLVYNACCLLVALVSELSASATGTEVTTIYSCVLTSFITFNIPQYVLDFLYGFKLFMQ